MQGTHLLTIIVAFLGCILEDTFCLVAVESVLNEVCQLETMNITCKPGNVVLMQSGYYGRMSKGRCLSGQAPMGCNINARGYLDSACSGKTSCQLAVPVQELHSRGQCSNDYTSYLDFNYTCLEVVNSADPYACSHKGYINLDKINHGYLSNQNAYHNHGTTECPWRLETEPGKRINLTLYSFLQDEEGDTERKRCYVVAKLRDGGEASLESVAACVKEPRSKVVYVSKMNYLEVFFVASKSSGAYLLEFSVSGCKNLPPPKNAWTRRSGDSVTVHCNNSAHSYTLQCRDGAWVGDKGNCTTATNSWSLAHLFEDGNFPYGILIVVAIGVALGVFCGGLLLTCVHAYMQRRYHGHGHPTNDPLYMERRISVKGDQSERHYSSPSLKHYPREMSEGERTNSLAGFHRQPSRETCRHEGCIAHSHSNNTLRHIYESPQFL